MEKSVCLRHRTTFLLEYRAEEQVLEARRRQRVTQRSSKKNKKRAATATLPPHRQPIHRLPVRPRPIGDERAGSYLHRLAEANHTATSVLAHLVGRSAAAPACTRFRGLDITSAALRRWATLADRSPERLAQAMAQLSITDAESEPLLWWRPEANSRTVPGGPYPDSCPRQPQRGRTRATGSRAQSDLPAPPPLDRSWRSALLAPHRPPSRAPPRVRTASRTTPSPRPANAPRRLAMVPVLPP